MHSYEFAYKIRYQTSTKMSPFEFLYGRKCRTLVTWDDPMDKLMLGTDLLKDLGNLVNKVNQNLKESQDRQKGNADKFRKDKYY